ncbi:hypothetical protein H2200_002582 [Cladophialophora chaetospira]|uniref:Uncharacterized protein n=1 Tax=Cladophialophora chaetospira TaxID=386627 RepID=A0AA38XJ86_9EURO|nr:hypothetical protein H2200_002582 [Cladophialophora chaetospira]
MEHEWAENRLADFNLWASGVGAAATRTDKISLDARLSGKPALTIVFTRLLQMLIRFLEKCLGIVAELGTEELKQHLRWLARSNHDVEADQELRRRSSLKHTNSNRRNSRSLSPWSDQSSLDSEVDESRQGDNGGLAEAILGVDSTMDQLHNLGFAIRRAGNQLRLQKADARFDRSEHTELESFLRFWILANTRPGSADVSVDLGTLTPVQLRLVEANLIRRNRFLYAQRHSRRLLKAGQNAQDESSSSLSVPTGGVNESLPLYENEEPELLPRRQDLSAAGELANVNRGAPADNSTATRLESATEILQPKRQGRDSQVTSTALRVRYPNPPNIRPGAKLFKCPSCCLTLDIDCSIGGRWRRHLADDVSPYSCIHEDCPKPKATFATRQAWTNHMVGEDHSTGTFWACLICLDNFRYEAEMLLADHIKEKHQQHVSSDQIPTMLDACQQTLSATDLSCPLCSEDEAEETRSSLDHIVEHVHSFALLSLPWAPDAPVVGPGVLQEASIKVVPWLELGEDYARPNLVEAQIEANGTTDEASLYFTNEAYFAENESMRSSSVSASTDTERDLGGFDIDGPLVFPEMDASLQVPPANHPIPTDLAPRIPDDEDGTTPVPATASPQSRKRQYSQDDLDPQDNLTQIKVGLPEWLNISKSEISFAFQDLEWKQRARLAHALQNPDTSPFRTDKSAITLSRNRYSDVQPWECSRIKLKQAIDGSDYINASPIVLKSDGKRVGSEEDNTGPSPTKQVERRYIATQGPKKTTFLHFWQMVLQESSGEIGVVIMLTRTHEGDKEKCGQYFPADMDNPDMTISALEPEEEISGGEKKISTGSEASQALAATHRASRPPPQGGRIKTPENETTICEFEEIAEFVKLSRTSLVNPWPNIQLNLMTGSRGGLDKLSARIGTGASRNLVDRRFIRDWKTDKILVAGGYGQKAMFLETVQLKFSFPGRTGGGREEFIVVEDLKGHQAILSDESTRKLGVISVLGREDEDEHKHEPVQAGTVHDSHLSAEPEAMQTSIRRSGREDYCVVSLISTHYVEGLRCEYRELHVRIGKAIKTVHHYLFDAWPDFGTPEAEDRAALIQLMKVTNLLAADSPRIVHDSGGVGRAGTFIALDFLKAMDETGLLFQAPTRNSADDEKDLIFQTVNTLREQRMMMVMNEMQYTFIYDVLRNDFVENYTFLGKYAHVSRGKEHPGISISSAGVRGRTWLDQERQESQQISPPPNTPGLGPDVFEKRLLACPYARHDPQRYSERNRNEKNYRGCSSVYIRSIARLKQHLYRVHCRPTYYCHYCFSTFGSRNEEHDHRMARSCERKTSPFEEKMTETQGDAIRRQGERENLAETWKSIYCILFPGLPVPIDPYQDG